MSDFRERQLSDLRASNQRREDEVHRSQLCTDPLLPGQKTEAFMDLVLAHLGIDQIDFELAVERKRAANYDTLEQQIRQRKLTEGVSGNVGTRPAGVIQDGRRS